MLVPTLLLAPVAIALVRLGWETRPVVARAGWAVAAAALVALGWTYGAWGIAVASVAGMLAAIACVLWAGWTSPPRDRRAPREAPAALLPRRWSGVVRRLSVFVLVVPIAFAAAQWLAYGGQAIARRAGSGEADAIVLTLILQPVLWGSIMIWQMTRAAPSRMVAPPAVAALLGTLLWVAS